MVHEGPPQPHNSPERWEALFNQPPIVPARINKLYGELEDQVARKGHVKARDKYSYKERVQIEADRIILRRISEEFFLGRHLRDIQAPNMFMDVVSGYDLNKEEVIFMMEEMHREERYGIYEVMTAEEATRREAKISNRKMKRR